MKQQVSLSLSDEILEVIDGERGLVPRSAYVEAALRRFFEEEMGRNFKTSLKVGKTFPPKERSKAFVFR